MTYDIDQLARLHREAPETWGNSPGEYYKAAELFMALRAALPALLADAKLGQQVREIRHECPLTLAEAAESYSAVKRLLTAIDGQREGQ